MFKLYRLDTNDSWKIVWSDNGDTFEGGMFTITKELVKYGIDLDEISFCVEDMLDKDLNEAYFGNRGLYMYGKKVAS